MLSLSYVEVSSTHKPFIVWTEGQFVDTGKIDSGKTDNVDELEPYRLVPLDRSTERKVQIWGCSHFLPTFEVNTVFSDATIYDQNASISISSGDYYQNGVRYFATYNLNLGEIHA